MKNILARWFDSTNKNESYLAGLIDKCTVIQEFLSNVFIENRQVAFEVRCNQRTIKSIKNDFVALLNSHYKGGAL